MSRILDGFDPHYLKYLAELGSTNLHAAAAVATEQLQSALDLAPGKRVLEIGCGTGNTILKFASESQVTVDGLNEPDSAGASFPAERWAQTGNVYRLTPDEDAGPAGS